MEYLCIFTFFFPNRLFNQLGFEVMLPINGLTSVIRVNAKNASFHKKFF